MLDIFRTEELKFENYVKKFRKKNIPKRYNQIELVDELLNKEIDHYFSISNRADGKSFNYIHFFINLSIDFGIKFMLLARQFTVRASYQQLIIKILDKSKELKATDFEFLNTQYYMGILYKGEMIGIITDLNSATNLKYLSNFIEDYPIIVYDEFLALEGDYLMDEWERLKTIYASIDRKDEIPFIKFPKIFYLGNAVNFSSPILNNLNLFNTLENHPINTVKQYENVNLEMSRNEHANEERNLRAFDESKDEMTKGQFEINNFAIATDNDRNEVIRNQGSIIVKLDFNYMLVNYNRETYKTILAIIGYQEEYDFNINLKDNTDTSEFLKDTYYNSNHDKKYNKEIFLFDNAFSKDFITNNNRLASIKITKLIRENEIEKSELSQFDQNLENYEKTYERETKRALMKKFFEYD